MTAHTRAQTQTDTTLAPARTLQRACACGESAGVSGRCPACAAEARLGVQPKLRVNRPGDRWEQEAERIADQVVSERPKPATGPLPVTPLIQRQTADEEEEEMLQAKPAPEANVAHQSSAAGMAAEAVASGGRPLAPAERSFFEPRLGRDLSAVRIHDGAEAGRAARGIGARAFTLGDHIAFQPGQLGESREGRHLLAHELVHTMQQARSARRVNERIQMQRGAGRRGLTRINVRRLQRMVAQNADSELTELITNNPLNDSFAPALTVNTANQQFRFELAVRFDASPLAGVLGRRGMTRPVGQPQRRTVGGTTQTRQQIRITLFTDRVSTGPIVTQIPDPADRLHSGLAETLHHELIHARLLMDRSLPPEHASATTRRLAQRLSVGRSRSFMILRSNIEREALGLITIARRIAGVQAQIPAPDLRHFLDDTLRFLLEEQYANQVASSAFGRPRSNADIAQSYTDEIADRIERMVLGQPGAAQSVRPSTNRLWIQTVGRLRQHVARFFDEIDSEIAHPMEEILPGFQQSGPAPPRPATLGGRQ